MTDGKEIQVVDQQETMFYQCVDCNYASAMERDLIEHMKDIHSSKDSTCLLEPNEDINAINENKSKDLKCRLCSYAASDSSDLKRHINVRHFKQFCYYRHCSHRS